MQYRPFGKLDWKSSALGFGCMRFRTIDGERNGPMIDEQEAARLLHHAIEHGVNYLDTAYTYHGGNSELFVGRILRGGYREKVHLATKLPTWLVQGPADFDRILNDQLRRLQTDTIDFYLLHGLNEQSWTSTILKHDILALAARALADGRIRHLGFSFHDELPVFEEILDSSDLWTFCQIQYNYMDAEHQAGTRGLKLAAEKGLAVVAMEPLMGGRLADPPPAIRETIAEDPAKRSPAQLALEWVWNRPEISVVLSGMNTMEQLKDNLRIAEGTHPGKLNEQDEELIARVREQYEQRVRIPCTKCAYCMPCPNDVNIPLNLDLYNYALAYDDQPAARFRYRFALKENERASACEACGICEGLCPQHIPVSEWMPKVAALLG